MMMRQDSKELSMRLNRCARIVVSVAFAVALGACATGPKVRSSLDASADFGHYRTYGFVEQPGTDRGDYATLVTRALKTATSAEMERRGYHLAENPDLLVNFQGHSEDKQELTGAPVVAGGFGWRRGYYYGLGGYNGVGCTPDVRDITQGTLNIDLIDRAKKQTVWEGTAVGELTEAQKKDLVAALPALAASIFSSYPYVAGQSAPVKPVTDVAKH
jgi:Domain of unknown function (DUF4136)